MQMGDVQTRCLGASQRARHDVKKHAAALGDSRNGPPNVRKMCGVPQFLRLLNKFLKRSLKSN